MMLSCAKPTGQDRRRRLTVPALALFCVLLPPAFESTTGLVATGLVAAERGAAVLVARNSSKSAESAAQIKQWIAQLGDEVFAVREEATNRLIRCGIEAKPMLMAALSNSDAEVRARAKRVLEIVVEGDFQRRLKAFADDTDGSLGLTMPGWDAFKEVAGSDRVSRSLFVEMQQAEPMLLEAFENGAESAARVLLERLQSMQNVSGRIIRQRGQQVFMSRVSLQPSLGSSLALLLVASDEAVEVKPEVADMVAVAISPNEMRTALTARDERSQVCRKLAGRWIARDVGDSTTYSNINTALTYNIPEGLVPAIRVLKNNQKANDATQVQMCYLAAVVVGNFGDQSHLPLIESLFDDERIVLNTIPAAKAGAAIPARAGTSRPQAKTEVRDVALAVAIKLSGQDPTEFGFDMLKLNAAKQLQRENLSQSRMGFRTDEDRVAAFEKWQQWQKEQPQTAEKPSKKDTVDR